jgi:hypothetical protein
MMLIGNYSKPPSGAGHGDITFDGVVNANGLKNGFTSSTFVSVGVLIAIVGGTWILANKISSVKTDILASNITMKTEFATKATNIEARVTALENRPTKETWSDGDMYRWAVHLQKANPTTIKVPEPTMKTDLGSKP